MAAWQHGKPVVSRHISMHGPRWMVNPQPVEGDPRFHFQLGTSMYRPAEPGHRVFHISGEHGNYPVGFLAFGAFFTCDGAPIVPQEVRHQNNSAYNLEQQNSQLFYPLPA